MSKLIYLAGGITNLNRDECEGWRIKLKDLIEDGTSLRWKAINPVPHIPEVINQSVEREQMAWDLYKLKHSDLVVCDFDHPNSIGTTWELAVARENGIPIIGLSLTGTYVHPWWHISAMHICNSIDDLYNYLCDNFLNED